jgi:polyhydroxyalkanoate synthesis regulator phasin
MAAQKKARKLKSQAKSIVDRFEGTIIEQPIIVANKAFLAGLGLASQVQSDFDAKFEELAKDGVKVRKEAENSFESLSDRFLKQVKATRKKVTKRAESAVNAVLEYSPVATTSDLKKLNSKIDKVLAQVAK